MEMFNYWTQEMGFNLGCIGRSKPSSQLTTDDVACLTNGNASPGKAPPKRQLSVEWGTAGATKAAEGPRTKPQTAKQLEKAPTAAVPDLPLLPPIKNQKTQIGAAVLIVLISVFLGYTTGLQRADDLAEWVKDNAPAPVVNEETSMALDDATASLAEASTYLETTFVNKYGQATDLGEAVLLATIILAPFAPTRWTVVAAAALPTAYVWLLPVAARLGFANDFDMLASHDQADIIGLIGTSQATGWMIALFSLPLFALLHFAGVGGLDWQYASSARTTSQAIVLLFFGWLIVGAKLRAPVRYVFPAVRNEYGVDGWGSAADNLNFMRSSGLAVPPGEIFNLNPPYASFTFVYGHVHPESRYLDLGVFAVLMAALAAHARMHRAAGRIGSGGAFLCIVVPIAAAASTVLLGAYGYFRSYKQWGEGPLMQAWPIAAAQAAGLTGLAFLPLLLRAGVGDEFEIEANRLRSGRSLIGISAVVLFLGSLPIIFNTRVDNRMDLSMIPGGAPCAETGGASLSSYIDSPCNAALIGLAFFFPLFDLTASVEKSLANRGVCNWGTADAALSYSFCLSFAVCVAFPLSYDETLHRSVLALAFFLAATKVIFTFCNGIKEWWPASFSFLLAMQVLAALAAIAVEMPTTTHSLFYHNIPQLSMGGFVPCPDASAWVIESVAFALVVVNTAYLTFMSRRLVAGESRMDLV